MTGSAIADGILFLFGPSVRAALKEFLLFTGLPILLVIVINYNEDLIEWLTEAEQQNASLKEATGPLERNRTRCIGFRPTAHTKRTTAKLYKRYQTMAVGQRVDPT